MINIVLFNGKTLNDSDEGRSLALKGVTLKQTNTEKRNVCLNFNVTV